MSIGCLGGVSDCQRLASVARSNSIRPVEDLHTSRPHAGSPSRPENETSMKLGRDEASMLQPGCFKLDSSRLSYSYCHQSPSAVWSTSLILPNGLAMTISWMKLRRTKKVRGLRAHACAPAINHPCWAFSYSAKWSGMLPNSRIGLAPTSCESRIRQYHLMSRQVLLAAQPVRNNPRGKLNHTGLPCHSNNQLSHVVLSSLNVDTS